MIRIVLNRHARGLEMLDTIAAVEELGHTIDSTANRLSMQVTGSDRVTLDDDLALALGQQFELLYQPQVSLKTGGIIGAEALIRWNHPSRGTIGPLSFIHKLEEKIVGLLAECQLNPSNIELEITESIIINNLPEEISVLRALKRTGVKLSVDDFGTGYSGLSYLQNYPFDIIKIDREFILKAQNKFTAIILAIINLAENLGMQTIAEGVENEEEVESLKPNKCEIFQGFFFSPPMNAESFTELLQSGRVFNT